MQRSVSQLVENFTRSRAGHIMENVRLAFLVPIGLSLALASCAPEALDTLPPQALIARAWARAEPPASPRALAAVAFASAQVGKPYCWGGTGPGCFDCSGLAQTAWRSVGVRVPRTADAIANALPAVPLEDVRAGDILWWPGHVGIYAGNGWVVEALDARHGVVVRPAATPSRAFRPSPT
jgi:cell wall-associated NlpC family hydrolase